jgi:hypothetical protein
MFFQPRAVLDFLALSGVASNLPTPIGTILCGPSPAIVLFAVPGAPFAVAVPDDCALIGTFVCAQGASLNLGLAFQLTNALDLTIGSY